jgi:hypothetical protein
MSLIVSSRKTYEPAPEGMYDAVCVDVADLGMVVSEKWGEKHKCRIMFELSTKMSDGRPYTVGQSFNLSLHAKATLTKFLKQWRGTPLTAEELKGFDLERLVGVPARIVVNHEENEGVVYGNITSIMKADPKSKLLPTGTYIRKKDRPGGSVPTTVEEPYVSDMGAPEEIGDLTMENIPF